MRFGGCRSDESILIGEHERPERRVAVSTGCVTVRSSDVSNPELKPTKLRIFSRAELEAATGGFEKASLMTRASQGRLYKGTLKDGRVVAVKRQECAQDRAALNNELKILATLHGPRFVNLLGFSRGSENATEEKLLIVDFMANGTLYDNLHYDGKSAGISSHATSMLGGAPAAASEPIGWLLRVQIALHVSKAILALHTSNPVVVHRDVNSSSVLIDGNWNAKLGDFGMALRGRADDNAKRRGSARGEAAAAGYVDLEDDAHSSGISPKVDVFSFGILLLEILSGRNAIDIRFKPPSIVDWAIPLMAHGKVHAIFDQRLLLPLQYAKPLRQMAGIAARCVRKRSQRRPSMSYVVAALQEVSKRIPMAKWADGLATAVVRLANPSCQSPDLDVFGDRRTSPEDTFATSPSMSLTSGPKCSPQISRPTGTVLGKPVYAGKALPLPPPQKAADRQDYYANLAFGRLNGRFVSRERTVRGSRLGERTTRITEDRSASVFRGCRNGDVVGNGSGDMAAVQEFPQATMEVCSLGGRRRVYHQWRNPMFDERFGPSELERATVVPLKVSRLGVGAAEHRFGSRSGTVMQIRRLESVKEREPLMCPAKSTRESAAAISELTTVLDWPVPPSLSNKMRSKSVRTSSRKAYVKAQDNFRREEAMLPW